VCDRVSRVQAKFRGYFVPPRPEKNAVEGQRMSDAFVEERRASLQKYLQKLAAHPVIGPSEVRGVLQAAVVSRRVGAELAPRPHHPGSRLVSCY
jgi:hypothetical protein